MTLVIRNRGSDRITETLIGRRNHGPTTINLVCHERYNRGKASRDRNGESQVVNRLITEGLLIDDSQS
jgi:hypothetical protein